MAEVTKDIRGRRAIRAGRIVLAAGTVALTVAILYFILAGIDLLAIGRVLLGVDGRYVIAFLLLEALVVVVVARRFQVVLRLMGADLPYHRCFAVNMAAYPLISLLPSISGNLVKVAYLKDEAPMSRVAGSVVAERLFDAAVLAAAAAIGLALAFDAGTAGLVALCAAAALTLAYGTMRLWRPASQWATEKLGLVSGVLGRLARDRGLMLEITLYTLLAWALALGQVYIFFRAVGAGVPLLEIGLKMPMAVLIGQLPVTLSGMGTRDGAMLGLFAGVSDEQVLAAGLLFTATRYWVPAVAGITFTLAENRRAFGMRRADG